MDNVKEYSIFLYFQQGEDFRHYLDESDDNVSVALTSWAEDMKSNYSMCLYLAKMFNGRDIIAHADGYHVAFEAGNREAKECLDVLVKEKVLNEYEIEEEEYGYDDSDEDDDGDDDDDESEPDN